MGLPTAFVESSRLARSLACSSKGQTRRKTGTQSQCPISRSAGPGVSGSNGWRKELRDALLPVYAYQIILRHPQRTDVRIAVQYISSENILNVHRVLREDRLFQPFWCLAYDRQSSARTK